MYDQNKNEAGMRKWYGYQCMKIAHWQEIAMQTHVDGIANEVVAVQMHVSSFKLDQITLEIMPYVEY